MTDSGRFGIHADPEFFREAITYTAAETGFSVAVIEKDYFCTVVLDYLSRKECEQLVFKGGTCLSKIHCGFHRLSEDLDFSISCPAEAGRSAQPFGVLGQEGDCAHHE